MDMLKILEKILMVEDAEIIRLIFYKSKIFKKNKYIW